LGTWNKLYGALAAALLLQILLYAWVGQVYR
jgi:hypothetical protein